MKILWRKWFVIVLVLSLVFACVSRPIAVSRNPSAANVEDLRALSVAGKYFEPFALAEAIAQLKQALQSEKVLSPKTLLLYDDLLDAYGDLQSQPSLSSTAFIVPPKSQMRLRLSSFCLEVKKAVPQRQERFLWKKFSSHTPYVRQLMALSPKDHDRKTIQGLIWNLGKKTYWENYPDKEKAILLAIDPKAPLKLPSKLRKAAVKGILGFIPYGRDVDEGIRALQREYEDYQSFADDLARIQSKEFLNLDSSAITALPDSALYVESESRGYQAQHITLYNPSDEPQAFAPADYVMEPLRSDVQRVGLAPEGMKEAKDTNDADLLKSLEDVLYGDEARAALGFIPVVNDVADIYESLTGRNFSTEQQLDEIDRLLSTLGVVLGSGEGYRFSRRALESPKKYARDFAAGISKAAKKSVQLTEEALQRARAAYAKARAVRVVRTISEDQKIRNLARAKRHLGNMEKGNLKEAIKQYVGANPEISANQYGKIFYRNRETGMQVAHDYHGKYFRVQKLGVPGNQAYLDKTGKVPLAKGAEYEQKTHFSME